MLVKELHISIDTYLQEMNSNVYGNVLPEEKDLILNWATIEFIDNICNPSKNMDGQGFQHTTRRYDLIRELIEPYKVIPLYKTEEEGKLKGALPYNYHTYINSRANVFHNCNSVTVPEATKTTYKVIWELNRSDETTNIYKDFKVVKDITTIFEFKNYYPNGLNDVDEDFYLYHLLFEKLNKVAGLTVYYSKDDDKKDRTLVIESDTAFTLGVQYKLAASALDQTIPANVVDTTYFNLSNLSLVKSDTRLVASEDVDYLKTHPFGKTTFVSPIVEIAQNSLYLYHNESFIADQVLARYIRIPKSINLSLNQCNELNDTANKIIARKAAEHIALIKGTNTVNNIIKLNRLN